MGGQVHFSARVRHCRCSVWSCITGWWHRSWSRWNIPRGWTSSSSSTPASCSFFGKPPIPRGNIANFMNLRSICTGARTWSIISLLQVPPAGLLLRQLLKWLAVHHADPDVWQTNALKASAQIPIETCTEYWNAVCSGLKLFLEYIFDYTYLNLRLLCPALNAPGLWLRAARSHEWGLRSAPVAPSPRRTCLPHNAPAARKHAHLLWSAFPYNAFLSFIDTTICYFLLIRPLMPLVARSNSDGLIGIQKWLVVSRRAPLTETIILSSSPLWVNCQFEISMCPSLIRVRVRVHILIILLIANERQHWSIWESLHPPTVWQLVSSHGVHLVGLCLTVSWSGWCRACVRLTALLVALYAAARASDGSRRVRGPLTEAHARRRGRGGRRSWISSLAARPHRSARAPAGQHFVPPLCRVRTTLSLTH